jgi:putative FmdB family regulatory protein
MPIYQYKCQECNFKFETEQSITEKALTICPHCFLPTIVRIITGGSGFLAVSGGASPGKAKIVAEDLPFISSADLQKIYEEENTTKQSEENHNASKS